MILYRKLILLIIVCKLMNVVAQQDPHFTQYMYNTMTVNPAYAGSQDHLVVTLLGRTQWTGFDKAPDTQTLSVDTPLNWKGVGLGINLMNDKIGPTQEIYGDANLSYTVKTAEDSNLSFGLKGGVRFWDLAKDELVSADQAALQSQLANLNKKVFTTIGAGLYYYTNRYYLGVSVPNMLNTNHYRAADNLVSKESFHFFGIAGYVFDLSERVRFKPAALAKAVKGAELSVDVSANFLFNEKFHAGLAWRWDDAISVLLGYQVNEKLHIGYAYDLTTSPYRVTNSGSHELLLKYHFLSTDVAISPRFF